MRLGCGRARLAARARRGRVAVRGGAFEVMRVPAASQWLIWGSCSPSPPLRGAPPLSVPQRRRGRALRGRWRGGAPQARRAQWCVKSGGVGSQACKAQKSRSRVAVTAPPCQELPQEPGVATRRVRPSRSRVSGKNTCRMSDATAQAEVQVRRPARPRLDSPPHWPRTWPGLCPTRPSPSLSHRLRRAAGAECVT